MCKMYISNLVCECCETVFPVPRKKSGRRGKGHVKHLWCYKCKDVKAHIELADRHLEKDIMAIC